MDRVLETERRTGSWYQIVKPVMGPDSRHRPSYRSFEKRRNVALVMVLVVRSRVPSCVTLVWVWIHETERTGKTSVVPRFTTVDTIPIYGFGHSKNGVTGNLYVRIDEREVEGFERKGRNVHHRVTIPLMNALLGYPFSFQHLDGEIVTVEYRVSFVRTNVTCWWRRVSIKRG